MEISKKIYNLRIDLGLTQAELAKIAGVSNKAISAWENGSRDPKIQPLRRICARFGIDLNTFIDEENDTYKLAIPSNLTPLAPMDQIPLVGDIACGTPILAEENITDYVDLPGHIRADFALTCRGDSMINARIFDGDVVYIRHQDTVDNGEIAAVLIDDEATLKRVRIFEDHIVLEPENPMYKPMVFWGEEMNNVKFLGKAVAFTSAIR